MEQALAQQRRCPTSPRLSSSSARATRRASRTGRTSSSRASHRHAESEDLGQRPAELYTAWGSVILRGGSREQAVDYVTKLYKQVPVLDSGARGATTTFVQRQIGDVHLAWENEAHLEVREAKGELELDLPADQHPCRAPRRHRGQERRSTGNARCRRSLFEVPLHRRGAGDHREALLPAVERRRFSRSTRRRSRTSSSSRSRTSPRTGRTCTSSSSPKAASSTSIYRPAR